jgi:hypothetical protein
MVGLFKKKINGRVVYHPIFCLRNHSPWRTDLSNRLFVTRLPHLTTKADGGPNPTPYFTYLFLLFYLNIIFQEFIYLSVLL